MVIDDLRDVPGFADVIAERCWCEWWADSDVPLAEYRAGIARMAGAPGIPLALVAHEGAAYAGSVLLIESDLEPRPLYTPWIAALWVEPAYRRRGLAERLVSAARAEAGGLGHAACYLCATAARAPYYLARGFRLVEDDVDGLAVLICEGGPEQGGAADLKNV